MLHQFLFWSCQKKAVPLQRISNKNIMCMKTFRLQLIFLLLWFVSLMLMLYSCSPGVDLPASSPDDGISGSIVDFDSPTDFSISSVLADTVTPPNNPMAPGNPSSYLSVKGKLGLNTFSGQYYATVRAQNNTYFLLDATTHSFIRFDYYLLTPFAVGEEIIVTGKLYKFTDSNTLGITIDFVQPAQ